MRLWARDAGDAQALATARENLRYLPGFSLPPAITVGSALPEMLADASLVLVATPIGALVEVVATARRSVAAPLFWLGKGLVATADAPGVALAHRVVAPGWPSPVGVISGSELRLRSRARAADRGQRGCDRRARGRDGGRVPARRGLPRLRER